MDCFPLFRHIWRWLWERQMDMSFHSPTANFGPPDDGPIISLFPKEFGVWMGVKMVNNRTDRRERIIGASVHLKQRFLWFWRKTLIEVPLRHSDPSNPAAPENSLKLVSNIELEPISERVWVVLEGSAPFNIPQQMWPNYLEVVIEFSMVGPMRKYGRVLKRGSILHPDNDSML
jgi:hypothetical protein